MSADELINKLSFVKEVKPRRDHKRSWIAQCPAHKDNSPSLYVDEGASGNVLIKCWSGCGATEVIDAVGVHIAELFPDDDYHPISKRFRSDANYHELHLEISQASREKGEKQSKADKESELASYLSLRGSQ
tara:strand:+ start:5205 stop:5597 length:393 start_codon:yes stop_codon:yes gene_type:complete